MELRAFGTTGLDTLNLVESHIEDCVCIVATGNFRELPGFSGNFDRDFRRESDEQLLRTLGTEEFQVEFGIDENLTAFDTSPVIQRTDTPNKKSEPEPPEPATTVQRVGAAHYSVWKNLKYITFVPGSACQMSQSIAYIRYWSRGNTNKKTPVQTEEQSTSGTDPQQKLKEDVDQASSTSSVTGPAPQTAQPSTRTILAVPENRANGRIQPVPIQIPVTRSEPSPKSGKVVSANPSGITIMGPVSGVVSAPDPTDAVWMFLFNPEELQLSSGPDYNRAETWGVSDPNNSGQPLSWRSNRNRKLSFGKVLLHGYTFGKRVDTLEAGLQQLFMARDGENGSDGPPVLEFVWGKRIFGPCVIQNIQVREKAWDKGILVNAEVSFELEQVPEWTINDGEVDILRPGRQPLVNDPLLPQGELNKEGDEKPPGGQKPEPSIYNPTLCRFATEQTGIFYSFLSNNYGLNALLGNIKSLISAREQEDIFKKFYEIKKNFYSGSKEVGEYVDKKLIPQSKGCTRGNPDNPIPIYKNTVEIILKEGGGSIIGPSSNQQAASFVKSCMEETKKYIEEWQKTSPKCEAERKQARELANKAEEITKCSKYRIGSECSSLASRATCATVNNGKTVVCRRNNTGSGPKYVWKAEQ